MGKKDKTKVGHVTEAESDAVLWFAVEVCKALGLPAWKIVLMSKPASKGAEAEIQVYKARYVASLWLHKDWMTFSDEDRRQAIVHEVCHLLHPRVDAVVRDAQTFMHPYEWKPWQGQYWREIELMVDRLALFMTDTFRLQDTWKLAHNPKERENAENR